MGSSRRPAGGPDLSRGLVGRCRITDFPARCVDVHVDSTATTPLARRWESWALWGDPVDGDGENQETIGSFFVESFLFMAALVLLPRWIERLVGNWLTGMADKVRI